MNSSTTDWRLQCQEKYLKEKVFELKEYERPRKEWDHEHCEFCGKKIVEKTRIDEFKEEVIFEAYVNKADQWICPDCFEDFKAKFEFKLKEPKD